MKRKKQKADFLYFDHGSLCTLTAITEQAKKWADDHLPADRQIWGAHGSVIEPRYVSDIIDAIQADELVIL